MISLLDLIENVSRSPLRVFNAKDDHGDGLDCLKVVQRGPSSYFGVHHCLKGGRFELRLVLSRDLVHWKFTTTLEDHAHQGYLLQVGREWLLASEKDGPQGNWIRIRVYADDNALMQAKPTRFFDIKRTLAPNAEGTPNILTVRKGATWDDSEIEIGFHFFRNSDVDRQARGTLKNFASWRSKVRDVVNSQLEPTYAGNIGDREAFNWQGKSYELIEAQLRKNDWSSWKIVLGSANERFKELKLNTPKGSTSFANPNVTALALPDGSPGLVVSFFLPSQGNPVSESGELIYVVR